MNNILIIKIKNALKTDYPIETIKEIISEYEEIHRLSVWRNKIIKEGIHLERHEEEIKRIGEVLESSGYYTALCDEDLIIELRKYFREL